MSLQAVARWQVTNMCPTLSALSARLQTACSLLHGETHGAHVQGLIFGWICWTLDWTVEADRAAAAVKEARGDDERAVSEAPTNEDMP